MSKIEPNQKVWVVDWLIREPKEITVLRIHEGYIFSSSASNGLGNWHSKEDVYINKEGAVEAIKDKIKILISKLQKEYNSL